MKSREHVTTNSRAAFYASMWEDLKKAATNCGWSLGLHGSLNSDMDIMAMPWTDDAVEPMELMKKIEDLFTKPDMLCHGIKIDKDKPNGRVVYTIHIWADFYLDINIISTTN